MTSTPRRLAALRAQGVGALAKGVLRPNESIDSVLQFLAEGLTKLATGRSTEYATWNENGLTQRLLTELERRPEYRPYFFVQEHMEDERSGQSPRGDMAVMARDDGHIVVNSLPWTGGKTFLALEAKRLPADRRSREREYLQGRRGGVERFKLGKHGSELRTVGMIGYVQKEGFTDWRDRINGWVDELRANATPELPWDEKDKLDMERTSPEVAWLRSNNLRVSDNQRLTVRHLWVQLAIPAERS